MQAVVKTEKLCYSYGKHSVVKDLNLLINRGDIYGFIGPNGAGKSTTIKLLLGLLTPADGHVEVFGFPLRTQKIKALRQIGAMVESPSLYPHLTGEENLEALRRVYGIARTRIDDVLALVSLAAHRKQKVKEYSLGMKQRLGIAATLLHNPQMLILDEPANGLDPSGMQELRAFLRRMAQEQNMTIFISSHLLSELEQVVNRVGIISKGALRFQGTLEELKLREPSRLKIGVSQPAHALQLLKNAGWNASQENEQTLTVDVENGRQSAQVNALLVNNNFEVFHLTIDQANLERAFMNLTRDENERKN